MKPVAWFEQDPDMKSVWYQADKDAPNAIPLYTHPAKESKAKDRFSNYESICLQCGTTIYKPAFKTLTDEQINWFAKAYTDRNGKLNIIDFARAILRKAQDEHSIQQRQSTNR